MAGPGTMMGLLIEGIVSSGKTSIIRELHSHDAWVQRDAKLVLNEFFTDRANEHLRTRDESSYRTLMRRNLAALEALRKVEASTPLLQEGSGRDLCFILERFHLSHTVHHAGGESEAFGDIDRELGSLGCKIVVLTVQEMFIESRVTELFRFRGPRWQMYQNRLEKRVGNLGAHFGEEQRKLVRLAEASSLEHTCVDTTERDWTRHAIDIMDFWASSGSRNPVPARRPIGAVGRGAAGGRTANTPGRVE